MIRICCGACDGLDLKDKDWIYGYMAWLLKVRLYSLRGTRVVDKNCSMCPAMIGAVAGSK